ncbi:unnamed protein product [Symbiodinium sp. CCMP2592]|nr:unnamed protein product [Symbiodinium sp. CCMP2592]
MLSGYPESTRLELQQAVARGLDPGSPWIEKVAKKEETVRRELWNPSRTTVERLTGCTLSASNWGEIRRLWWKLQKDTGENAELDSTSCISSDGTSIFSEGSQVGGSDVQSEDGEYHVKSEAIPTEPFRGNVFEYYANLLDAISEVSGPPIRRMMREELESAQSDLGIQIPEPAVRQFMRQAFMLFHSPDPLPYPGENADGFSKSFKDHVFSWLKTPADISSLNFSRVTMAGMTRLRAGTFDDSERFYTQLATAITWLALDAGFTRNVTLTIQCADPTQASIGTYTLQLKRSNCQPDKPFFDPLTRNCVNFCPEGFYRNLVSQRCSRCNTNCKVCTGLLSCKMCVPDDVEFVYVMQPDGKCQAQVNHIYARYRWWCLGLGVLLVFLVLFGCVGICTFCCSRSGKAGEKKDRRRYFEDDLEEDKQLLQFPPGRRLGRY